MFGRTTPLVDSEMFPGLTAGWFALCVSCACCILGPIRTSFADDAPAAITQPMPPPRTLRAPLVRRTGEGTLDRRVSALSKALDLDVRQQAELRKILENQQVTVRKIWSDSAVPAAERVPATRAVEDRAAEQIRAILNEDQKKRYNPPKPRGPQPAPPNVDKWIEASRSS